jgi:cytochrome P450
LLGHALSLRSQPLEFLKSMPRYGDVVRIDLGWMPVYVVNDPDLIRQLLVVDSRKYDKGSLFEKAAKFIGNGLATSSGDFHRRQRRQVQPGFHHSRFEAYADIMSQVALAKAESWQPGQQLELSEHLHDVTLVTVARTLFSTRLGDPVIAEIRRSLPFLLEEITRRSFSAFPFLEKLPTPRNRRFDAAVARMREVTFQAIDTYRSDGADHGDLMSILVATDPQTGHAMPPEQIHDEVITLMMAGTETSASTLSWAFHEVAADPRIEQKLHEEVDAVLAGRPVGYADVPKLEYTRRLLSETMRMHGFPLIPRRALTEVTVGGRDYPAGTQFFISPHALHQNPRYYPEPQRFDPDRWLPERAAKVPRDAFIPFGAGVRKCLGDAYAWTDMTIIAATIAARWQLRPAAGHQVTEIMAGVSRPDRLPMTAHPRDGG